MAFLQRCNERGFFMKNDTALNESLFELNSVTEIKQDLAAPPRRFWIKKHSTILLPHLF